jgi:hypothetical protein
MLIHDGRFVGGDTERRHFAAVTGIVCGLDGPSAVS